MLLKKAYHFLFFLGIFLIPFNSDVPKVFKILGEFGADSSPVFFLVAFVFLAVHQIFTKKIYFPFRSKIYLTFLLFFGVILLVTAFNLPQIIGYYLKFTTGIERFIRQLISIVMSSFVFFYVFINVGRDLGAIPFFKAVRKTFFISFIFVFITGALEFLIISGAGFLTPLLNGLDYLPFVKPEADFRLTRLSSLTFEPPALGTYLITVAGFMFSYILTSKKAIRYLPFLGVLLLAVLSKSRTALVVVVFQAAVGIVLSYYKYYGFRKSFNILAIVGVILMSLTFVVYNKQITETVSEKISSLDFTKMNNRTDKSSISNKTRLGVQVALFEVFKENPVIGVGWGMQAFETRYKYPFWAKNKNYEFPTKYQNKHLKSFPPSYNLYMRILTEAGIVGILFFGYFIFTLFRTSFRLYKNEKHITYLAIALIISFSGLLLNWFQIDSLRIYGFWISLAILILINKKVSYDKASGPNPPL